MNKYLTTTQVLQLLSEYGVSIKSAWLRQLLIAGRIVGAKKFGRDWTIPRSGVLDFLGKRAEVKAIAGDNKDV